MCVYLCVYVRIYMYIYQWMFEELKKFWPVNSFNLQRAKFDGLRYVIARLARETEETVACVSAPVDISRTREMYDIGKILTLFAV